MNFIFEYSSVNEIKLSEIKKKARKNYDSFMAIYDKWKTNAEFIAQKENFYEEQVGSRAVNIIICIVGIMCMIETEIIEAVISGLVLGCTK
jgi:hypothetical protein